MKTGEGFSTELETQKVYFVMGGGIARNGRGGGDETLLTNASKLHMKLQFF